MKYKKAILIIIFSFILCPRIEAKLLMGVTKIKKMYLMGITDEFVEKTKVEEVVKDAFDEKLPDIKLEEYKNYKKGENQEDNVFVTVVVNTLDTESKRHSGGLRYAANVEMTIYVSGHDELGSYTKIYWEEGIIIAATKNYLIFEEAKGAIEMMVNMFAEEWNKTKQIFNQ